MSEQRRNTDLFGVYDIPPKKNNEEVILDYHKLEQLSREEAKNFYQQIISSIDSLSSEQRMEFFEIAMSAGVAEDEDMLRYFLNSADKEEKESFARFIFYVIGEGRYVRSFHICWKSLSWEDKVACMDYANLGDGVYMPYVALAFAGESQEEYVYRNKHIDIQYSKRSYRHSSWLRDRSEKRVFPKIKLPKEMIDREKRYKELGNVHIVSDIIQTCIREAREDYPNFDRNQCVNFLNNYLKEDFAVLLLPHLRELVEVGYVEMDKVLDWIERLTSGEVEEIFDTPYRLLSTPDYLLDRDSRARNEEMQESMKKKYGGDKFLIDDLSPDDMVEYFKYHDQAREAFVRLFGDEIVREDSFYSKKSIQELPKIFLLGEIPSLLMCEILEIDEQDLEKFFLNLDNLNPITQVDGSDLKSFMEYAHSRGFAKKAEELILQKLDEYLQSNSCMFIDKIFVAKFDTFFSPLSVEVKDKIVKLLLRYRTILFLEYGGDRVLSADKEVVYNLLADHVTRLSFDTKIFDQINKLYQEGSVERVSLYDIARQNILDNLDEDLTLIEYYKYVTRVMGEVWVDSRIDEILGQDNVSEEFYKVFFYEFINKSTKEKFLPKIKEHFQTKYGLFESLLQDDLFFRYAVDKMFGENFVFDTLLVQSGGVYLTRDMGRVSNVVVDKDILTKEEVKVKKMVDKCLSLAFESRSFVRVFGFLNELIKKIKDEVLRIKNENIQISVIQRYEGKKTNTKKIKSAEYLSTAIIEFNKLSEDMLDNLLIILREYPDMIFDENLLNIKNEEIQKLIREHIFDRAMVDSKWVYRAREYVNEEEFEILLREKEVELAFTNEGFLSYSRREMEIILNLRINKMVIDHLDRLKQINPYIEYDKQEDYYEYILERVKDKTFFPVYAKKLKKIINRVRKETGQDKIIPQYSGDTDPEFDQIIKIISSLDTWDGAMKWSHPISGLSSQKQVEMMEIMNLIIWQNKKKEVEAMILEEGDDFETFSKICKRVVSNICLKSFDMKMSDLNSRELPEVDLLKTLMVYGKNMRSNVKTFSVLKTVVDKLFRGKFYTWREWGCDEEPIIVEDKNKALDDLKSSGLLPTKLTLQEYEMWQETETAEFEDELKTDLSDLKIDIQDVLAKSVSDGHIGREMIDGINIDNILQEIDELLEPQKRINSELELLKKDYPTLLKKKSNKESQLPTDIKDKYDSLMIQKKDYMTSILSRLTYLRGQLVLKRLFDIREDELLNDSLSVGNEKISFRTIFGADDNDGLLTLMYGEEYPNFISDIASIRIKIQRHKAKIQKEGRVSRQSLILTDNVDLLTHIQVGERPVPSCQSYNSSSSLAKGLISYCVDPSIKIIQMRDENGTIIARSVLRLMSDISGKPVLFMERIYAVQKHREIDSAFVKFAKKKAEIMSIPFYRSTDDGSLSDKRSAMEKTKIYSKGSRAPYVYTDSGGNLVRDGKFSIQV